MKVTPGKVFGKWVVIRPAEPRKANKYWVCRCSCGVIKEVYQGALVRKNRPSRSCMACRKTRETHGMTKTPLHNMWSNMKQRCYNPKHQNYKYYGGKGVKVCEAWMTFVEFYEWAKDTYITGMHIHRYDSNGDYSPENCVLLSPTEHSSYQ